MQTQKVRYPQISAFRAPIHERKSGTSIRDTYRMRSVGDHHATDSRGYQENSQP